MTRRFLSSAFAVFATAATVLACSSELGAPFGQEASESTPAPAASTRPRLGCLQGVVVNAFTGERLEIPADAPGVGIKVLVGNSLKGASLTGDTTTNASLKGEYTLCDLPLEARFPIFITLPGYEAFESRVLIPATSEATGDTTIRDRYSDAPTFQANIRLFPVASAAQPYTVTVSSNGVPVAGARVTLTPTGTSDVAIGAGFLAPTPTTHHALSGVTDANGAVVFQAADLALGANYRWQVLPPDGGAIKRAATGVTAIGYITEPGFPYQLKVDIEDTKTDLYVVSSSADDDHYSEDGSITFVFNRPIEIVPGTAKDISATLDNAVVATLADEDTANQTPERVQAIISGNVLTLKPVFKAGPDRAREPALAVLYRGVQVRPADGDKLLHVLTLAPNVSLYGGVKAPPVPNKLVLMSGDAQQGSPSSMLSGAIIVQLQDQYGDPMSGVPLSFTTAGGGTVTATTVNTNGMGNAQTRWTLGVVGEQSVSVAVPSVASIEPLVVTAAFLPATSMTIITGNSQAARFGTKLTTPLKVRVADVNGVRLQGQEIEFTVQQATGGGVAEVGSAVTPAMTVKVMTDALGEASAEWTLGTVGGDFMVTATLAALSQSFTATSLFPTTIVKISGDNQNPVANNTTLPLPIVVEVRDQRTTAMSGIDVQFAVTGTNGTVQIGAGAAAATVTGTTGVNGRVSATWHLSTTVGAQTATVTVNGIATPVTFTATGT